MEAQAFVESDTDKLLDVGMSVIPKDSVIHQMIGEIREWHASEPDWRKARERLEPRATAMTNTVAIATWFRITV